MIKKQYELYIILLYALLAIVYLLGAFIPLMENDSAQHATMAMQMMLDNDYLNLYRNGEPYLDKPHLHFWLSALSFKIFGISDVAYRIPALIFTFLGALSCYALAKMFYEKTAGIVASLIFLSAQAIILSTQDLRTDALLTGACAVSVWQLILYVEKKNLKNIIIGAIFAAMAFSTKGYLGLLVIFFCLLTHIIYKKEFKVIFSWKVLIGFFVLFLSIAPVVYAYYYQFDAHPETVVQERTNVSGVKFIFWDQVFNRLNATGFKPNNSDYLFFFHTILWAFFPWAIIMYAALFKNIRLIINKSAKNFEVFSSVGVLLVLLVISFSKFKLPHYINSVLPITAVLVAGYLFLLAKSTNDKLKRFWLYLNSIFGFLAFLLVCTVCIWAFHMQQVLIIGVLFLVTLVGIFFLSSRIKNWMIKLVFISISFSAVANIGLNTLFYPKLLQYQAGNVAVQFINEKNIKLDQVFRIEGDKEGFSFDFYSKRITPRINFDEVKLNQYLFVYQDALEAAKAKINFEIIKTFDQYRITKLKFDFLNPKTRDQVVKKAYLIKVI